MRNAARFRAQIAAGSALLGAAVTLSDPIVSEAIAPLVDFLWIDVEHNPLTAKQVEGHLQAAQPVGCPVLVRVPLGDVNLVKQVLDAGADGIVAPQVRTVDDARRMVAACRYPPLGTRGFGPRRAVDFGASAGPDYPARANAAVLAFVMLEDINAVDVLDDMLALPGLDGVCIGPADLSASLGVIGQLDHPAVQAAIDTIIARTRARGLMVGVGGGDDPATARAWIERGVQWLQLGGDVVYLRGHTRRMVNDIRPSE